MSAALEQRLAAVRNRYAEPQRHYHGVAHLDHLLRSFTEIRSLLRKPDAVRIAIFYHDAIYWPERSDNEVASARLMRDELDGLVELDLLANAEALILATRDHRIPAGLGADVAADCALFLDMDISVLGADAAVFDIYEAGIAAEYRPHYDFAAYGAGRAAVLDGFLGRARLFLSDAFAPLEERARGNLSRSLQALRSPGHMASTSV
ncbi:MAG: hypothetical protein WCC64_06200, partial [Aliidongia sp.]